MGQHHLRQGGESVWQTARLVSIDQEIKAMPMQWMTSVGTGIGVTTGGESQRIAIARALNANATRGQIVSD